MMYTVYNNMREIERERDEIDREFPGPCPSYIVILNVNQMYVRMYRCILGIVIF